uniref:Uncharacterized protein n=1 Tax=Alexandrium andersonii TaxID=327968 RepID=A0A6U6Q913_9DINO
MKASLPSWLTRNHWIPSIFTPSPWTMSPEECTVSLSLGVCFGSGFGITYTKASKTSQCLHFSSASSPQSAAASLAILLVQREVLFSALAATCDGGAGGHVDRVGAHGKCLTSTGP